MNNKRAVLVIIGIPIVFFCVVSGIDAQSRTGQYNRKDREKYGGYGILEIREVIRNKKEVLSFDLWIGRRGPTPAYHCTGGMKGVAKWTAPNVAEFNVDLNARDEDGDEIECHLIFFFSGNIVTVRGDVKCANYHGAACQFDGIYKRKPTTPKKNRNSPITITV